jgi:hypothetical protein
MIPSLLAALIVSLIANIALFLELRAVKSDLKESSLKLIARGDQLNALRVKVCKAKGLGESLVQLTAMPCLIFMLMLGTANAQSVQSIVSNGQLQNRDFTLLLIHGNDQVSGQVVGMMTAPRTDHMRQWVNGLHLRAMNVSEPFVEHHRDLLQKHQAQLPIVALVDPTGGVWWSAAAGQIPLSEADLVTQLAGAYYDTLKAAGQSQQVQQAAPAQLNQPARAQSMDFPSFPAQSRFLDRGVAAPDPIRIPSVNVTTNTQQPLHPQQPGGDDSTLLLIGVLCVVCSLILAAAPVIGSTIIANAMTDEQDEPT